MSYETKAQGSGEEETPVFPLDRTENDNSADSPSVEETDTDQTPSSEEDKEQTDKENGSEDSQEDQDLDKEPDKKTGKEEDNLADHPRWKEREEDWKKRFNNQEVRHIDEMTKMREDFDQKIDDLKKDDDSPINVPDWFGGDEEQYRQYLKDTDSRFNKNKEEIKSDTLKEIDSKSTAEQKAIDEATTYFKETVADIEAETGEKIDQNKLLKITLETDGGLIDSKGKWNYRAAYKIMKSAKSSKKDIITNEKKKVAGASVSENKAEDKKPSYATSADFQGPGNNPW